MHMHYVYHPEHPPKVVCTQEYYKLLEEGWYDSPTKFPSAKPLTGGLAAPEKKEPELNTATEENEVSELQKKDAPRGKRKEKVIVKTDVNQDVEVDQNSI